jgi:hypothetical protein
LKPGVILALRCTIFYSQEGISFFEDFWREHVRGFMAAIRTTTGPEQPAGPTDKIPQYLLRNNKKAASFSNLPPITVMASTICFSPDCFGSVRDD